jgi:transcriptional regulator with XRE-family HTH domain
MQESNTAPYKSLGSHLKYVREQKSETLAEAAGAVEVDIETLERFESGIECPAEDVLMLLIDHFDVKDQEAVQLWESAGYTKHSEARPRSPLENIDKNATIVVLALDMRTQYTDGIEISTGKNGLVMQFTQDALGQAQPVAKLGMSYDQAEEVLKTLQLALLHGRAGYTQRRLDGPH